MLRRRGSVSLVLFFVFLCLGLSLVLSQGAGSRTDIEAERGDLWIRLSFEPDSQAVVLEFRARYPFPPGEVFSVMIDTNHFSARSNYKDAGTLSEVVFKRADAQQPENVKALYRLIGSDRERSDYARQAGGRWTNHIFLVFDFPWPLTDRWSLQRVEIDESRSEEGVYRYAFKMHSGNFDSLRGHWELAPIAGRPGWTEFRGSYHSDLGIFIQRLLPRWLIKRKVMRAFEKDMDENDARLRGEGPVVSRYSGQAAEGEEEEKGVPGGK